MVVNDPRSPMAIKLLVVSEKYHWYIFENINNPGTQAPDKVDLEGFVWEIVVPDRH